MHLSFEEYQGSKTYNITVSFLVGFVLLVFLILFSLSISGCPDKPPTSIDCSGWEDITFSVESYIDEDGIECLSMLAFETNEFYDETFKENLKQKYEDLAEIYLPRGCVKYNGEWCKLNLVNVDIGDPTFIRIKVGGSVSTHWRYDIFIYGKIFGKVLEKKSINQPI